MPLNFAEIPFKVLFEIKQNPLPRPEERVSLFRCRGFISAPSLFFPFVSIMSIPCESNNQATLKIN